MLYTFKRWFPNLHLRNLKGDFLGGLTVSIVALPLALAFGVSSGAGAITGLYGAIFVGIFAAIFGGTPSQISGPTGPMTVVMASVFTALTAQYGVEEGLTMSFTVVMLGGLFQIIFGALQLGTYITMMPYTVISGFMSGIGVIIVALQLGPFLGHTASASVIEAMRDLPTYLSDPNGPAVILGAVTLVIVFTWPRRLNRIVPSPLLALVVGTVMGLLFFAETELPVIGEIPSGLPELRLPEFEWEALRTMTGYGLMLATLGAIDSLLTSLVADNITRTEHDPNRELIGQGIGNMVAGLFGGLPGAGATMRTVVNVQGGGRTPYSGVVHSLCLLVVMLGAGALTEPIPHAVLAGILIKVGINIIDWSFLRRAHRISLKATGLMYGVLFLTVFVDLITAVAVGVFFANLLTIKGLSELQAKQVKAIVSPSDESLDEEEQDLLEQAKGRLMLFAISGPMSFGSAKAISQQITMVNDYDVLILDLSNVPRLGVTASLAIETMVLEANQNRRDVFLVGAHGRVLERLDRMEVLAALTREKVFESRVEALRQGVALIDTKSVARAEAGTSRRKR